MRAWMRTMVEPHYASRAGRIAAAGPDDSALNADDDVPRSGLCFELNEEQA